jgi:hypothetical protein
MAGTKIDNFVYDIQNFQWSAFLEPVNDINQFWVKLSDTYTTCNINLIAN